MLEDFWMHTFFDDPEAATKTFEDTEFDVDDVAERIRQRSGKTEGDLPNDFEDMK